MNRRLLYALLLMSMCFGCGTEPEPDGRDESIGYRTGTALDDYRSNGERGNVSITEIMWAGSVYTGPDGIPVHRPDDIFIELQNKHPRPIHLTGWLLTIRIGHHNDGLEEAPSRALRSKQTYVIPARENGNDLDTNELVVIAARRDGAFQNADYFIEDLRIPNAPFEVVLQDLDERLIDHIGDHRKQPFAGAWDGVVARSMERIQLIFNNRGNRDSAWHTYSLNDFDDGDRADYHQSLRRRVHSDYAARTFATPGRPNSPDYSGNISSGTFE